MTNKEGHQDSKKHCFFARTPHQVTVSLGPYKALKGPYKAFGGLYKALKGPYKALKGPYKAL